MKIEISLRGISLEVLKVLGYEQVEIILDVAGPASESNAKCISLNTPPRLETIYPFQCGVSTTGAHMG